MMSPPTVRKTTVVDYKALVGVSSNTYIVNSVQHKTHNQHTAENSVISKVSFLFTVATTYIFVGEKDTNFHTYKKKSKTGAQKLVRLVRSCNNNATIRTVLPGLIFSTNNNTICVFKGKAKNKSRWYLIQDKEENGKIVSQFTETRKVVHIK